MSSHTEYNKTQTVKYLFWTFSIAWLIQVGTAWFLNNNGNAQIAQMAIAAIMFVPMLGVLLSGGKLRGMGWKPHLCKNIKTILIAWFAPAVLTAAGAALYFLVFPGHFDLSGEALGANAMEQLEAQGISYSGYVLIAVISCLTYAPLVNMLFAVGEETGWRGFLYPQLKTRFGERKGWILGGVIWGVWHWPLIWLLGYEYGTAYVGFPVTGMLAFCVFTVACGILCDWLYERSGCIWMPAVFHGSFNASGTVPIAICIADSGSARLLGPAPNGLIAGLPFIVFAAILMMHCGTESSDRESSL